MSSIVVSPVGGVVEAIDFIDDEVLVYIKVTLCKNFKAIAPQDSSMEVLHFQRGLNLDPNSYKAKLLNEQLELQFDDCKVKFISGMCNKSIDFIKKDSVYRTEPLGVFFHGIVVVTLSKDKNIELSIGQKIAKGAIVCK